MEYEARTIKWYWVAVLVIYSFGCIYLLLHENPLLYSQGTLKSQQAQQKAQTLKPWPPPASQIEIEKKNFGREETWPYLSEGHLNMASPEVTRNKSYTEFKTYPLKADFQGSPKVLLQSEDSVFLIDENETIYSFDSKGELHWTYGLQKDTELDQTLLDSALLYLIRKDGTVTTVNIQTGQPHWNLETGRPVYGEAWLENEQLILPVQMPTQVSDDSKKSKKLTSSFLRVDRHTGSFEGSLEGFDFKQPFKQVKAPHMDLRILYSGSQLVAIPKTLGSSVKTLWTTTLAENISGDLVLADSDIFAVTESSHLYVLNAKKKGDVSFDIDLDFAPQGALTYLPEMERVAYLGSNTTLRVVDLDKKQMAWKFDLSVRGPLRDVWTARLKGAYIQEFGMKWVYKGWTIWSPCRTKQFCIYNPDRGQLIQRIALSGEPVTLPHVYEDKLVALLKLPSGEFALSYLLDPGALRDAEAKAAKEAASAH